MLYQRLDRLANLLAAYFWADDSGPIIFRALNIRVRRPSKLRNILRLSQNRVFLYSWFARKKFFNSVEASAPALSVSIAGRLAWQCRLRQDNLGRAALPEKFDRH
jgi:hypothetical protein